MSLWQRMTRKPPTAGGAIRNSSQSTQSFEGDDSQPGKGGLRRVLGIFQLTSIGVSSTIGAGIYVLTGSVAAEIAGPAVVISYIVAGLASFLSALCYCELSSLHPKGGSAYSYVSVTMGEAIAFLVGWNLILEYIVGSAAIVRSFTGYLTHIANQTLHVQLPRVAIGVNHVLDFWTLLVSLSMVLLILAVGLKRYSTINAVGSILNMVALFAVVVIGAFYADPKNWSNFAPFGARGVMAGASVCFFSYVGFDVVASLGDEAIDPHRSVPVSIFLTLLICGIVYVAVATVLTLMAPLGVLASDAAFINAFMRHGNVFATVIVGVGATFGLLGCVFSSFLPSPRIMYTMACDGLLFEALTLVSERTGVPVVSTIVGGIASGFLGLFLSVHDLVEIMSIGTLIAYTAVCAGVIVLRSAVPLWEKPHQYTLRANRNVALGSLAFCFLAFIVISVSVVYGYDHLSFSIQNMDPYKNLLAVVIAIFGASAAVVVVVMCKAVSLLEQSHTQPTERTFMVPLVPFLPLLAILFNVFLMASLRPATWIRFLLWLVAGFLMYFLYGINHSIYEVAPTNDHNLE